MILHVAVAVALLAETTANRGSCPPPPRTLCACCADWGEWNETSGKLSSNDLAELARVRFDSVANTYHTGGGGAPGDALPAKYSLAQSRTGRRWRMTLRDDRGRTSTLAFTMPATATTFKADLHDGVEGGGGGPLLYKEWRLDAPATGNGIFARNKAPRVRVVLQGRGNNCVRAEDFTHWTIRVSLGATWYSFNGSLGQPESP